MRKGGCHLLGLHSRRRLQLLQQQACGAAPVAGNKPAGRHISRLQVCQHVFEAVAKALYIGPGGGGGSAAAGRLHAGRTCWRMYGSGGQGGQIRPLLQAGFSGAHAHLVCIASAHGQRTAWQQVLQHTPGAERPGRRRRRRWRGRRTTTRAWVRAAPHSPFRQALEGWLRAPREGGGPEGWRARGKGCEACGQPRMPRAPLNSRWMGLWEAGKDRYKPPATGTREHPPRRAAGAAGDARCCAAFSLTRAGRSG